MTHNTDASLRVDELIERLRDDYQKTVELCAEAADALAAQRREIENWRALYRQEETAEGKLTETMEALAAARQRYQDEHEIVDRVWKALGIATYEGANGKAIYEIVAEQKAALAAAEKKLLP